jgi:hypothetical protein
MLGLTAFTALHRFFRVWRQADAPPLRPGSIGYRRAQREAGERPGRDRLGPGRAVRSTPRRHRSAR